MALISDHAFRGGQACLYPHCGKNEAVHRDSVDGRTPPPPHWFVGLSRCFCCGIRINHPAHYLTPARMRLVGLR